MLDTTKASILKALVNDGLLTLEKADDWAASHAPKLENKTIWRTLTNRWNEEKEVSHFFLSVVSRRA